MLKGGVIMDVVTPEQSAVAEDAGAVSVMALERVPVDIRKAGGVARTTSRHDYRNYRVYRYLLWQSQNWARGRNTGSASTWC